MNSAGTLGDGSLGPGRAAPRRTDVERRLPIGVFDSGIGGLSVVGALRRRLPGEDILYFGDTARVPYGTKSAETVIRFARESVNFLTRRGIKLLVIACNTASAVALPALRAITSAPLVGVLEPGVRAAFERTRNGRVGVIATEATVRSGAYRQALEKRSASTAVFEQPCPLFVPLVEEGWTSGDVPRLAARRYLQPLLDARIDTLILGCTHYPLLRDVIAEVVGANVGLVDSGEETALETAARLAEEDLVHPRIDGGGCRVYVSDRPQRFGEIGEAFLREALGKVELVDQSDLPWYAR